MTSLSKLRAIFAPARFKAYAQPYGPEYTAKGKAQFAVALVHFIEAGFPRTLWTKKLYTRLSLTFGFIAHYNADGFRATYFDDTAGKVRFLRAVAQYGAFGDPAYTHCDVEKAVQRYLAERGVLTEYEAQLASEVETAERVQLAALKAKYEVNN